MRRREAEDQEALPPRRRRDDMETFGKRLAVRIPPEMMKRFRFRWVNSEESRLMTLYNRDWDIVKPDMGVVKEDHSDLGEAISIVVGRNVDGSPLRAYLCRKPRQYYDEDVKKHQTELDNQMRELRRGNSKAGEPLGDYTVPGGISIA